MEVGKFFDVFTAIVGVAMAFVIVSSKNTAQIISAWGSAFSSSLAVATGQGGGGGGKKGG
jgi:hypothetical protein